MKNIYIIAILFFSNSLLAMQTEDAICHIARLPKDVQDIIASYLNLRSIETEKDFIYRTEIKSYNVSDYHREAQNYERPHDCFSAYSPDNLKKVYLDQGNPKKSKVIVWDTVPKKDSEQTSLDVVAGLIDEDKEYYQTIDVAISSDRQWFGRLAQKKAGIALSNTEIALSYAARDYFRLADNTGSRAQITVIHIPTLTKKEFQLPILLKSVVFLDFNNQGTEIITHGTCYEKEEPIFFMYPIVTQEERKAKNKKTLADYFRQRGVCKNLANSLRLEKDNQ